MLTDNIRTMHSVAKVKHAHINSEFPRRERARAVVMNAYADPLHLASSSTFTKVLYTGMQLLAHPACAGHALKRRSLFC